MGSSNFNVAAGGLISVWCLRLCNAYSDYERQVHQARDNHHRANCSVSDCSRCSVVETVKLHWAMENEK